jgi:hypothetical protein
MGADHNIRFTRRSLMAGAAALAAAPLLPAGAGAQTQRVRKDVAGPNSDPAMLEAYKRAVRAMLQLPPRDPRNWYRQALVHLIDCPHGNWWFLPWHRGYLLHFEQICAQLSGKPDFALPFWDWTANPSVPAEMFADVLTPTHPAFLANFNAYRSRHRTPVRTYLSGLGPAARADLVRRGLPSLNAIMSEVQGSFPARPNARGLTQQAPNFDSMGASAVTLQKIRDCLAPISFETFGSDPSPQHSERAISHELEGGPHDNVHGAVGGFMGAFMSPVDPIFWLHHCNIDRLWAIWTKREKAAGRTGLPQASADWIKEPFRFFCDAAGAPLPDATAGDYVDIDTLGYSYGTGSGDIAPPTPLIAGAPVEVVATASAKLQLKTFAPTSLALSVAPDKQNLVAKTVAPQATPAPSALVARVTFAPPSGAKNYRLRVFANCPYLTKDTPVVDPHYVGAISFFGVGHGTHGAHEVTYTLPIGRTLQRLAELGRATGDQIKLQVLAVDNSGQVKPLDGALTKVTIQTI